MTFSPFGYMKGGGIVPTPTPSPTITPTPTATVTPTPTPSSIYQAPLPSYTTNLKMDLIAGRADSYPGSGTTWTDLQGNYDGTLVNNPAFINTDPKYFRTDDVNDEITFPGASDGLDTVSKTFGGWYKFPDTTVQILIGRGRPQISLYLVREADSTIRVAMQSTSATTYRVNSSITCATNTWYYIMGRWNASTNVIQVIINGVQRGSTSTSGNLYGSTVGWELGKINTNYWANNIAEMQIYEEAVSDANLLANFNAQKSYYGY